MTELETDDLRWLNRLIYAHRDLSEPYRASLSAWLAAGEKRTAWPGWERILGPRPAEKKANANAIEIVPERKRA